MAKRKITLSLDETTIRTLRMTAANIDSNVSEIVDAVMYALTLDEDFENCKSSITKDVSAKTIVEVWKIHNISHRNKEDSENV